MRALSPLVLLVASGPTVAPPEPVDPAPREAPTAATDSAAAALDGRWTACGAPGAMEAAFTIDAAAGHLTTYLHDRPMAWHQPVRLDGDTLSYGDDPPFRAVVRHRDGRLDVADISADAATVYVRDPAACP